MNDKSISSEIVIAYSQCPLKAYLLLFSENKGEPHDYTQILDNKRSTNRQQYLQTFREEFTGLKIYDKANFKKVDVLLEARLQSGNLEAYCDVLNNVNSTSEDSEVVYEPTLVVGTYSISEDQKTELQYVGIVLGKLQKKIPLMGVIVGMDGKAHKLKLESGYKKVNRFVKILEDWILDKSVEPPPIILNKYCQSCPFQNSCKIQAQKENNLSLLDRLTTQAIQRYNKRGIFTVHQLSYTYKPRRKKKGKIYPIKHRPELQALAIKENKIYIQELSQLSKSTVEIFMDIESIPDQNFYYLIGLLICSNDENTCFSFWADSDGDEKNIFMSMISKINEYPDSPIYHYGNFELKAINALAKKYSVDCECVINRLINVNAYIYGKIYFPTRSNSLKDIGEFLNYCWNSPKASGFQSIVWRYFWEENHDPVYKETLLIYNQDDCQALQKLTNAIYTIQETAHTNSKVDFADTPKRLSTEKGKQVHEQLEVIIKSAHADYDKNKISLQSIKNNNEENDTQKEKQKVLQPIRRKVVPKARRLIECPSLTLCPIHSRTLLETTDIVTKTIIDLAFERNGIRKIVVKYWGMKSYCLDCDRYHSPLLISQFSNPQVYGHGFQVWVAYQRIALRVAYRTIVKAIEDQFNEIVTNHTVRSFIKYAANYYSDTETYLIEMLRKSPIIHADETPITIEGTDWYVWVFTDGIHVLYKLTSTRESKIVSEILSDYKGVLISDFYAGYDAIECKQQKCWVHLIRDLNNDLWKAPYDNEYENFVLEVRNLILPIFESIEKHGLKKRYLEKFKAQVTQFYENVILNKFYKSELVIKYQKRLKKYQDSLFVFMENDDIPWHNNTAENAIRHIAKQRDISGSFYESQTHSYLLLAGIYKTCQFQNKSFLKFLLSEEKNIDSFKQPKRSRQNTRLVGQAKKSE